MKKIKVMIIEDSITIRKFLEEMISCDERLEIVASVENAEKGLQILYKVSPDVISLDIRLPGMNGLQATLEIMKIRPTPIVVIADNIEGDEYNISLNALRSGALAVIDKSKILNNQNRDSVSQNICHQLVTMSEVKLVRQRIDRHLNINQLGKDPLNYDQPIPASRSNNIMGIKSYKMLGLVASTGGPQALITLLSGLPINFPLPILLVQHITASFLESFAKWLENNTPFSTKIVRDQEKPLAGTIYLSPADYHLVLEKEFLTIKNDPLVSFQRPSGTVLFKSMAYSLEADALGVLLTGMGDDGAQGLLEMRRAGAYTITEDESTAVVYGMPKVADEMGASCEKLPIDKIAQRLVEIVSL